MPLECCVGLLKLLLSLIILNFFTTTVDFLRRLRFYCLGNSLSVSFKYIRRFLGWSSCYNFWLKIWILRQQAASAWRIKNWNSILLNLVVLKYLRLLNITFLLTCDLNHILIRFGGTLIAFLLTSNFMHSIRANYRFS